MKVTALLFLTELLQAVNSKTVRETARKMESHLEHAHQEYVDIIKLLVKLNYQYYLAEVTARKHLRKSMLYDC